MSPRCRTVLAAALCAAAALAPGAAASRPSVCKELRGRSVVPSPTIKIVARPFHTIDRQGNNQSTGVNYLACVLPRGRVRLVGSRYANYLYPGSTTSQPPVDSGYVSFGQSAGAFILVRTTEGNLTGDYLERTFQVVDARSGAHYTYFHYLLGGRAEPAPPAVLALNSAGELAGIVPNYAGDLTGFSSPPAGMSQVIAFGADRKRRVLDQAPIAAIPWRSLRLLGNLVSWTNAGMPRSTAL